MRGRYPNPDPDPDPNRDWGRARQGREHRALPYPLAPHRTHPAPEQEREQQALGTEGKLLHRQEQELKALRKRITSGAEEQRQARQQDLERLLQRCHHLPPT